MKIQLACMVMVACLAATGPATALTDGIVIRGGTCSADAFKKGAELADGDNIVNLSVNCTTAVNDKRRYAGYTAPIPGPNFCVGSWASLEKAGAKVKTAPVPGNPLHCLVSGKASKLAGVLTRP